ncbi:inositol hexakisphosphate kinase isoform X2 [Calliopsis andreniformis]
MKELLEKKILKTGPYRPNSGREVQEDSSIPYEKDIRRDWKNEAHLFKAPPYILGYTGYIPGFNSRYGLSFMRAVEEGAREWRENQSKLRARREAMRAQAEKSDPRNLLSRARTDHVATEIDHGHSQRRTTFHYEISPERPPIVGYTGHIPGVRGEVALSKRYTQAARKGLELIRKEREERHGRLKDERVLDVARA